MRASLEENNGGLSFIKMKNESLACLDSISVSQRGEDFSSSKGAFVNDNAVPEDTVHAANASSAEWVFSKGKKARKCAYIPFGGGLPQHNTALSNWGARLGREASKESNILLLFPEY